jgi:APA family basic amino acid/polyamine antiporter
MAFDSSADTTKLRRSFGLFGAVMLGIGAMIGAGIFVLSGIAAGEAGPALLLAFALNGVAALAIGSCYAELASAMPRAGGSYYWIKQGFGPITGFYSGWISFYANTIAAALYAKAFGAFTIALAGSMMKSLPAPSSILSTLAGIAVIAVITIVEYRGAKETVSSENVIVGIKIALLLVFIIIGGSVIFHRSEPTAALTPFLPNGLGGLAVATALTFIAFEGFEVITRCGEEIRFPHLNIPRAIFLSILISVCLYLLVAAVMLLAIEPPAGQLGYQYLGSLGELGMAKVAGQIMPYGEFLFYVAGMASTVSAMIAAIYSATRVGFAMGRAGDLPTCFAHIHRTFASPYVAVLTCTGLMVVMVVALPLKEVAVGASMMFALLFTLVCLTTIRLRQKCPNMKRPFRVFLSPYLPALGIAACGLVFLTLRDVSPLAWIANIGWLVLGLPMILGHARWRKAQKRS